MAAMSRRFQYSLRALLVGVTGAAVCLGLLCDRVKREHATIDMICDKGGGIAFRGYGWIGFPWELWVFEGYRVEQVFLTGDQFGDDDLPKLAVFPRLERIVIRDDTSVTEAGVASLRQQFRRCEVKAY